MINTLLITNNEDVSKKINRLLENKKEHKLEVASINELINRDEVKCDIIIYHIDKNEIKPFEVLKFLSDNAPVVALVDGKKLKDSNKTSIKLMQNGAKTILYDIKENILFHSIERIYDLEYGQDNMQVKLN